MEDFDIEVNGNQETTNCNNSIQLPMNFLRFGEIEPDDVKVYIKQDVYKALEKYALVDVEHERGTIILGDYYEELGKTHVVISDYIEARYTDASASTLTFTHETWDYVYKEHDEKYPDKKIIGWQHTHPSYGIFLSNYDLFIQENFFNLPFQIAYVIDPVQQIRGFFQWKNGKIEKLKGYYVYDDIGVPIKISQSSPVKKEEQSVQIKTKKWPGIVSIISVLLSIVCLISLYSINLQNKKLLKANEQLSAEISDQDIKIDDLNEALKNAQGIEQVEKNKEEIERLSSSIAQLNSDINKQKEVVEQQGETIKTQAEQIAAKDKDIEELNKKVIELEENAKNSEYIFHTIQKGETLSTICSNYGINYWKCRDVILGLNAIADENRIIAGKVIILPKGLID